jgi:hypothetical protein
MADVSLLDVPYNVALALSIASSSTGADFDYLLKTAHRESSFQVDARASTSSAQGLFQFIEETWLRTIKEDGPRFGLQHYADKIEISDSGKYTVADPKDRRIILDLRNDPNISAMMAGVYARRNADYIATTIGRRPTSGELYLAHFLGPSDAARLILLRNTDPDVSAVTEFPRAAEANRSIFYDGNRERTVAELYDRLVHRRSSGAQTAAAGIRAGASVALGQWDTRVTEVIRLNRARATGEELPWLSEDAAESAATTVANLWTTKTVIEDAPTGKAEAARIAERTSILRGSVADTATLLAMTGADQPAAFIAGGSSPLLKTIRVAAD